MKYILVVIVVLGHGIVIIIIDVSAGKGVLVKKKKKREEKLLRNCTLIQFMPLRLISCGHLIMIVHNFPTFRLGFQQYSTQLARQEYRYECTKMLATCSKNNFSCIALVICACHSHTCMPTISCNLQLAR